MTSPTPTNALVRVAMTRDEHLDDIKRARIWSELEDRLAAPTRSTRRWPLVFGASAATLVAAAAIIALVVRPNTPHDNALAVPPDTAVSAQLGPHTRASLLGPARLELDAVGDTTSVHLRRGTLLADFAGGTNRSLQIITPDARIEIVGTLFAVEVGDGAPTCTSVEHGRVKVTTPAITVFVTAGQRYCVGAMGGEPIAPSVHEALERHGATIVAAVAVAPPVVTVPVAVAPPVVTAPVAVAPTAPPTIAPIRATAPVVVAPVSSTPPTAPPSIAPIRATAPRSRPRTAAAEPARDVEPARTDDTDATTSQPASQAASAPPPPPAQPSPTPSSTPPQPTPQPTPQPAPKQSAADLYHIADAALTARDLAAADRALATLVAEHRDSRLVDQALFDRARIAHQRRDWQAARQHLAALAAMSSKLLAEPGHWLRCRVDVDAHDQRDARDARSCLTEYRRAFPGSPHDLDALALLARLAHATSGCAGAAIHVDELALRYPRTTLAAGWRTRCPTTSPGAKP